MRACNFSFALASLTLLAASLLAPGRVEAQREVTLHSFGKGLDGNTLYDGVISDSSGNLYGTTFGGGAYAGGAYGAGIAFELSPQEDGTWSETVLHNFGRGTDGSGPADRLVFDSAGNLYGTTYYGGGSNCIGGCGTVFQLRPPAVPGGAWTESLIYRFQELYRGLIPEGGLITDSAGNLYGTTLSGGLGGGTVFELSPTTGLWTERILYAFGSNNSDGAAPSAALILDSSGNLYSTTSQGGTSNAGTVFELSPQTSGGWRFKILHNFKGDTTDGSGPLGNLLFDSAGNLYGSASLGGAHDLGTLFELKPSTGGSWTEHVLYNFGVNAADGAVPVGGLLFDAAGNLFGVTNQGGMHGEGTLFEMTRVNGVWTEQVLHNFGHGTDGRFPSGGLLFSPAGNIYGTCTYGGAYFSKSKVSGTVFEVQTK